MRPVPARAPSRKSARNRWLVLALAILFLALFFGLPLLIYDIMWRTEWERLQKLALELAIAIKYWPITS